MEQEIQKRRRIHGDLVLSEFKSDGVMCTFADGHKELLPYGADGGWPIFPNDELN